MRLRPYEWLIIAYYTYVAAIAPIFIQEGETRWLGAAVASFVVVILFGLTWRYTPLRDWVPLAFTLGAYREMQLVYARGSRSSSGKFLDRLGPLAARHRASPRGHRRRRPSDSFLS